MNKVPNILIVDDNQINLKYFSMSLAKSGFNVELAEDGYKAIELAHSKLFDVILMDIRMPELNGFETSKLIIQTTQNKNTPIIATSAEKLNQIEEKLFTDFLLKPISPIELSKKIKKQFSSHQNMVFDKQQALDFAYNDITIMKKLMTMFAKDLPLQLDLLASAITETDFASSLGLIHKIQGSCKTCGAIELDAKLIQLRQSISNHLPNSIDVSFSELTLAKNNYLKSINKIID